MSARGKVTQERNRQAKAIAKELLGYAPRITRGRGTAYGWLRVTLKESVSDEVYRELQWRLVNAGLAGVYYSDDGYDTRRAQVNIDVERPRE